MYGSGVGDSGSATGDSGSATLTSAYLWCTGYSLGFVSTYHKFFYLLFHRTGLVPDPTSLFFHIKN
jgi:hypothetical protein